MRNLFYYINENIKREIKNNYEIRFYYEENKIRFYLIFNYDNIDFDYEIKLENENIIIYQLMNSENKENIEIFKINYLIYENNDKKLYQIIISFLNDIL